MTDSQTAIAPAFPHNQPDDDGIIYHPGLTKREYFAAMVLNGVGARYALDPVIRAADAVAFADALIAELAK